MSEITTRLSTALAGRYTIDREIGAGGMATVYLAHDVKHDRQVALKVLRPDLAAVIGAERFLVEIKTTANLQHPHILPLHDSGEVDGTVFYVMPFVEGESLRDRLSREKQLPVPEAIRIATEVAGALSYAHGRGIIHRDIKPENILLHEGQALVADFGIALAAANTGDTRMTETGMSLGTPHYMSPEQAMGERDLDARTDVYALGCVLYEMLTGEPPFDGPTAQSIVAKVMASEPEPVTTTRKTVPPGLAGAVHTAIQRLPADRFASAHDFAAALARPGVADTSPLGLAATARPRWHTDWRSIAAVTVAVLATMFAVLGRSRTDAPPVPVVRFTVALPEDRRILNQYIPLAITRDGTRLAYVGAGGEAGAPRRLYSRSLDELSPVAIPGTDGAGTIFFSPDGASLGFWLGEDIFRIPFRGGPATTLVLGARQGFGSATWTDDGHIVYPSGSGSLAEVPDGGGESRTVYGDSSYLVYQPTALQGSLIGFARIPVALGIAGNESPETELVVVDRSTGKATPVLRVPGFAEMAYASSGHLVYLTDDGVLFAAPFDIDRIEVTGPPVPLREGVDHFTLSESGTLVLIVGDFGTPVQLMLVDRAGRDTVLAEQRRDYLFPRFSPDGRRVAAEIHDEAGGHIWIYDRDARTLARLTAAGHNSRPVWSPDGREVAYVSSRDSTSGFYRMNADGGGAERRIGRTGTAGAYTDVSWSPDGARLAFDRRMRVDASSDIVTVAAHADSTAQALIETPAAESHPVYSPDGRWLAYVSDESGRPEIYVRASSGSGGRWIISMEGGEGPQWASTTSELFYFGADRWLNAVTLEFGAEVRVTGRERLFDTRPYDLFSPTSYGVHPNGRQFVFVRSGRKESTIEVILNWSTELRQYVKAPQ